MRRLIANVVVGDTWYGPCNPGAPVTDAIARQITNPDAWSDDDDLSDGGEPEQAGATKQTGPTAAPTTAPIGDGLDDMDRDDLVVLANARQVDVPKRASKPDIIALLRKQD